MNNIRKILECCCDLYTEGIIIEELELKTKLTIQEIINTLKEYKGLFYVKSSAGINFIYLRKVRSLKCAYTMFKYSNISELNFEWDNDDLQFMNEMSNPKYVNRTFNSLCKSLDWNKEKLLEIISKWQNKGIICKQGKKVVFTYLGWPLWAAIIVNKIWLQ